LDAGDPNSKFLLSGGAVINHMSEELKKSLERPIASSHKQKFTKSSQNIDNF
jgi:hypothetical protein